MIPPLGAYVLEVGQGDACLVIDGESRSGDRRGVLIDCGPGADLVPFLRSRIDVIEALFLTHNDRDHAAGAIKILREFGEQGRINAWYSLIDNVGECSRTRLNALALAMQLHDAGLIPTMERLECSSLGQAKRIKLGSQYAIDVHFPSFADNVAKSGVLSGRGKPNATSAVLRLVGLYPDPVGLALWGGDLPYDEWAKLFDASADLSAFLLVVPHHGSDSDWSEGALDAFFGRVSPAQAAVSVGTNNHYGHPKPVWFQGAIRNNVEIRCTQLTSRCGSLDELPSSRIISREFRTRGYSCAGSLVYNLDARRLVGSVRHDAFVRLLRTPMCR
jgi:competence protein ComEC